MFSLTSFNLIIALNLVSSKAGEVHFYQNFKGGPLDGKFAINKEDFEKDLKLRYELMGWNPDNGVPTPAKLIELNLD
jgi:aldehyde:ferredoxin oxidoreductase